MNKSVILAIILMLLITVWVLSGSLFGDSGDKPALDATDAPRSFSVVVRSITPQDYIQHVRVRGRTEAVRAVVLKAEIDGPVVATPARKGARVREGDVLCRIATNERQANVDQAKALAAQRHLELEASEELAEKGHRSTQQVAAAKALYGAAEAQVRLMEVQLENTAITAPFDGFVEDRLAEVGDYLQKGGACARLVEEDPFLVVGEVSEQNIGAIELGSEVSVRLSSGEVLTGHIRYLSATATERTRTFRVEAEVANPLRTLREGLTAEIEIPVRSMMAALVPASALVLDADGRIGVRIVDAESKVAFQPIAILSDAGGNLWIDGLPEAARVITVGQEFVSSGQTVTPVEDEGRS